ncbi:MAG: 2-oxo acid dehydrogenase subunit E2 [Acidimicrobiales bacterium]|nr:2-oxo acid dehydrogenase subunit E2 [Acidimicrobiales bacterium]
MATKIQMPKLGLTMTEGTITEWVAAPGQVVTKGSVIMTIETDKVQEEVEADGDGILFHSAEAGDTLEPGEIAGWLLAEGESPPDGGELIVAASSQPEEVVSLQEPQEDHTPISHTETEDVEAAPPVTATAAVGRILSSPNARRVAAELGTDISTVAGSGPGGRITSEDVEASPPVTAPLVPPVLDEAKVEERRLVPFAARIAAERLGVAVAEVIGTGPEGRVSRQDIYNYARSTGSKKIPASSSPSQKVEGERIPIKGMRGIIAERMHSSLQEMAQLTLTMDVEMDRTIALREQLKDIGAEELGAVPGYTDFVIAAVAQALREHPGANSQVDGNDIVLLEQINIGMAVAVPDGLVVPVIHGTDFLGLPEIAQETTRLATAAREKKLSLAEMEGGTFSVTALGMFGVDAFTPVINPPNAGILGVGRIRDDVRWEGEQPVRVKRMMISLTWDHRVLDGAPAAEFAATIKNLLEQPLRLLG